MAKLVQVSDDAGVTWYTLPGGEGAFNRDAGQINDTIFGQSYESNEAGLVGWNATANAIYKGAAGYNAQLSKQGTSTASTGESMTLVSGKTYQIDAAAHQIWDRSVAPVVYDNAVDHTADVVLIDYLFGKVTFASTYTVTGPVTVDINYFPTVALGQGKNFTLTQSAALIDTSTYAVVQSNGGYRTFNPGLRTVGLELGGLYALASGFAAALEAHSEWIVEVDPIGDGLSLARGFFRLTSYNHSGPVGQLEEDTATFALNVPLLDEPYAVEYPFEWDFDPTTTAPTAVQKCIEAFQNETKPMVQYLDDGTNGDKGTCVVSNFTLSNSLEEMNVFAATFTGDGAPTVV